MAFLDKLFRKKAKVEVIDGYCPNCWGYQEYQGKIYDAAKLENIDLNNIEKLKGWIQAYAAKNLDGIRLRKKNGVDTCLACTPDS